MTIAVTIKNDEAPGGKTVFAIAISPGSKLPEGEAMERVTTPVPPGESRSFHLHRGAQLVLCEAP